MNTEINIAGISFKNPVMTASGTFGSGMEYGEFFDLSRLGAVTTKGVANVPWEGNPTPRVAETPSGMLNAASCYEEGFGTEKNAALSLEWYQKSAEAGYITSMYTIGRRYELGNGVEQNTETAIEWYQKAAEAGNKKAADRLAELNGN